MKVTITVNPETRKTGFFTKQTITIWRVEAEVHLTEQERHVIKNNKSLGNMRLFVTGYNPNIVYKAIGRVPTEDEHLDRELMREHIGFAFFAKNLIQSDQKHWAGNYESREDADEMAELVGQRLAGLADRLKKDMDTTPSKKTYDF